MELEDWFRHKKYDEGVAIFKVLQPENKLLISLFESGLKSRLNSFLSSKLDAALSEILAERKATNVNYLKPKERLPLKAKAATKAALSQRKAIFWEEDSTDEVVMESLRLRKSLNLQRADIKSKLNQAVWLSSKFSNAERGLLAKELSIVCCQLQTGWAETLYYRKKGELPTKIQKTTVEITDINELYKRLMSVRTYISKYKKEAVHQAKLHRYTAELNAILSKIESYEADNQKP